MENIFTVSLPNGRTQKGLFFDAPEPKMNLLILTGMGEHSGRYEDFAKYLNGLGINVRVLDAVAQGLNAPKVEYQERWHQGAFDENVLAANLAIEEMKKNELPTCIMGHSMGSFMIQRYLQLYPNTVNKTVICGSNKMGGGLANFAFILASMITTAGNRDEYSKLLENLSIGSYIKAVKDPKTPLDWLSYNEENVQRYADDPYCGAKTTRGFWKEFARGLKTIASGKEAKKVSQDEDILIIAGEDDPVGRCGKGPRELLWMYQKRGVKKVKLVLFDKMRHEILQETRKDLVYDAISRFLLK